MKPSNVMYVAQITLTKEQSFEVLASTAADRAAAVATIDPMRIVQLQQFEGTIAEVNAQVPQRAVTPQHDDDDDACPCGQCTTTRLTELLAELMAGDDIKTDITH